MSDFFSNSLFPLALTLLGYRLGLFCQRKLRSPLCNPILIAVFFVLGALALTGLDVGSYQAGNSRIAWLLTPATIALAVPMYEQLQVLKKDLRAMFAGITAGTLASLLFIVLFSLLAGFERTLTVSLLPKSVTTAIGAPLSELSGGTAALATAAIICTGILANVLSPWLFRLFRLENPIARGVALGTAGHVIGTSKANEISPLVGAVSSLSLVTAGLLTAAIFPLAVKFIA